MRQRNDSGRLFVNHLEDIEGLTAYLQERMTKIGQAETDNLGEAEGSSRTAGDRIGNDFEEAGIAGIEFSTSDKCPSETFVEESGSTSVVR